MVEDFDKDGLQFAGFGCGGEEGTDPAVVGGEAAACRFCRAVEDAEFAVLGEFGDEGFVFRDCSAGVAAVCGVDEELEEVGADDIVGGLGDLAGGGDGREGLHFADAEELAQVYARDDLCAGDEIRGPAIVREALSTTYITQNQIARVGRFGEIGIERIR